MNAEAFSVLPTAPAPIALRRSWGSRAANAVLALAVLAAVAVGAGALAGLRVQVVLTGSMAPAIEPGDMVVVKRLNAADMRVGDIVSFAAPAQRGVVMTHRVRSLTPLTGGRIAVETRGDANSASERWSIAHDGSVARVERVVPFLGHLTGWARDPDTRLLVFGILGALIAWQALRWIWRD